MSADSTQMLRPSSLLPFLPLCALHSSKSSPSWLWQDPSLLLSSLVSHSSLEVGSCALTGGPGWAKMTMKGIRAWVGIPESHCHTVAATLLAPPWPEPLGKDPS